MGLISAKIVELNPIFLKGNLAIKYIQEIIKQPTTFVYFKHFLISPHTPNQHILRFSNEMLMRLR